MTSWKTYRVQLLLIPTLWYVESSYPVAYRALFLVLCSIYTVYLHSLGPLPSKSESGPNYGRTLDILRLQGAMYVAISVASLYAEIWGWYWVTTLLYYWAVMALTFYRITDIIVSGEGVDLRSSSDLQVLLRIICMSTSLCAALIASQVPAVMGADLVAVYLYSRSWISDTLASTIGDGSHTTGNVRTTGLLCTTLG